MKRTAYGQPVSAQDVEEMKGEQPQAFVRLCEALVSRLPGTVKLSGDLTAPDSGIDFEVESPPETPDTGWSGPGRTVGQIKWRSATQSSRGRAISSLSKEMVHEARKFVDHTPDRYLLLTNVQLTPVQAQRLRGEFKRGCPSWGNRPWLAAGAADLVARVNNSPAIRNVFFADLSLMTYDRAAAYHEALNRRLGSAQFVGRASEVAVIQEFLSSKSGVLIVHGPHYIGKTRLVLEALRSRDEPIVWSLDPAAITSGAFRDLDEEPDLVFVLDDCSMSRLSDLTRWALGCERLKTILISVGSFAHVGADVIGVTQMPTEEMTELLRALQPSLPHLRLLWLRQACDGHPGLAYLSAYYVLHQGQPTDDAAPPALGQWLKTVSEPILNDLSDADRRALEVFSVLQRFSRTADASALKIIASQVGATSPLALEPLLRRGLIVEQEGFCQVTPTALGDALVGRLFSDEPRLLVRLLVELPHAYHGRLIERLTRIAELHADLREQVEDALSPGSAEELARRTQSFLTLAFQAPERAAEVLERVLKGVTSDTMRELFRAENQHLFAETVSHLLQRPNTFSRTAKALTPLVAEECSGGSATTAYASAFLRSFNYRHPFTAVPFKERLAFVRSLAMGRDETRQYIACLALGEMIASRPFVAPDRTQEPGFPLPPEAPSTRTEAQERLSQALELVKEHLERQDPFASLARKHVVTNAKHLVEATWTGRDFSTRMTELVFGVLNTAYQGLESLREQGNLISQLERVSEELNAAGSEAARTDESRRAIHEMENRVSELRKSLIETDWTTRLRRHVGPRTYSQIRTGKENQEHDARRIARDVIDRERDLQSILEDWLLSEEAENSGPFFRALGECDEPYRWRDALLEASQKYLGPDAFSRYLEGWASRSRTAADAVESYLDDKTDAAPEHWKSVLAASLRRQFSDRTVTRFLRLVGDHPESVPACIDWLRYSPWMAALAARPDLLNRIAVALYREGDRPTDEALVHFLAEAVEHNITFTDSVRAVALAALEATAGRLQGLRAYAWDVLAAALCESDTNQIIRLLVRAIIASDEDLRGTADHLFNRTIHTAAKLDRLGLVREFLRLLAMEKPRVFYSHGASPLPLDLDRDEPAILDAVRNHGEALLIRVAFLLDADDPQFHDLASRLLAATGFPIEAVESLLSRVSSIGFFKGSALPTLQHRLDFIRSRRESESDDSLLRWLCLAEEYLDATINARPAYFWDTDLRRQQIEEILARENSPEHMWAVRRILTEAPFEEAVRLLTREHITAALDDPALDEERKEFWRAYIEHQRSRQ
jgi:hypothetical protein